MANNVAEFRIWDVQHGSACYVSTPNNQHVVIDLGVGDISDNDEEFSPLLKLKSEGVERLDCVIITHPHRDHIDDIFNFDELNPKILSRIRHLSEDDIRNGNKPGDSTILDKYFEIDARYNNPVKLNESVLEQDVNGGLLIQRFIPTKCPRTNLNNHSMVTVCSYAGSKIIIPGDNEAASWQELLEDTAFVSAIKGADVLIAAHHGREAGYCDEIFEHFTPRLTIISDGPFLETSATDKYCAKTKGWKVHKADGSSEQRQCLTTRSDGSITVRFGQNGSQPFIAVHTEK